MKSQNSHNSEVIVSGAQQTGNFSIAANGKAFKILIDGLYSNKIQAIIRELSSNAYDSQAQAGRGDKPFDLYLPNLLDPTFAVRDYGTSLSHENVMGLYTTVFQSTKEDTNLAVGKFGLGSKTPFAYTDSFTVTAYLNGTKRVYGAYIDVSGIPMISLMASDNTSEDDGLMVSFPVASKDCDRFKSEAEVVLRGFDVLPNVKGASLNITQREPILTGSNYKIYEPNYYGSGTKVRAKQGCVIYPIDPNAIPKPWSQAVANIMKTDILIDFPVGSLDITPSRETLSYDDATINNIVSAFEQIDAAIIQDYQNLYKKVNTYYEAVEFQRKHSGNGRKYNASYVPSAAYFLQTLRFNGKIVDSIIRCDRANKGKKIYSAEFCEIDDYDMQKRSKTLKFRKTDSFTVKPETVFIVEDVLNGPALKHINARIRNNVACGDIPNLIWIRTYGTTEKQWRRIRKLLGYAPHKFLRLEDFALPEKQKSSAPSEPRIERTEARVEILDKNFYRVEAVINVEEAVKEDYKYIIFFDSEYFVEKKGVSFSQSRISRFVDDRSKIIVIKERQVDRFDKAGMKNFLVDHKAELEQKINFDMELEYRRKSQIINHNIKNYSKLLKRIRYNKENSIKTALDIIRKFDNETAYLKNKSLCQDWEVLTLYKERDQKLPLGGEIPENLTLKYWVKQIRQDYPMISYIISENGWDTINRADWRNIINYVKLVDKNKNGK